MEDLLILLLPTLAVWIPLGGIILLGHIRERRLMAQLMREYVNRMELVAIRGGRK